MKKTPAAIAPDSLASPMRLALFSLLALISLACGPGQIAPADSVASPSAVATAVSSSPTSAPFPTPTPVPTITITPVPTTTAVPIATETPTPAATAMPIPTSAPPSEPTPAADTPTAIPTPTASIALQTGQTPPDALGYVGPDQIPAPAPAGLDGWINSAPLDVEDLKGRVVLLDFWTYTCVNCIRTLPYLQQWHDKYADEGLLIIGVHTPEFEFEKINENVRASVADLGVEYPVAQDNNYLTWSAYRVQAWPSKYIMDGEGFVRYYHRGEGSYADTERVIRFLLEEMGRDISHIEANSDPDPQRITGFRATDPEELITRELYGGTRRNIDFGGAYIVNQEYYEETDVVREYTDPGERRNHFIFLRGMWLNESENLSHARATADYEDYLGIKFYANEVNAVLDAEPGAEYQFRIVMDGAPVPEESAGEDIAFDENGDSVVIVNAPRMYRLVRQREVSAHELLLMPKDENFSLYSFTFGAYPLESQ